MRTLVLALALVNLVFFGWSYWIDRPSPANASAGSIPGLELAPTTVAANPAAPLTAAATTPIPTVAAVSPTPTATAASHSATRCASLGPLLDPSAANAVNTALLARNLNPRRRISAGETPDGYWVYIDRLRDGASRALALKRLARAGVRDAAALAGSGQVSVGLFSEKAGADMRAAAVRAAGLEPVIESRTRPANQYWFDVDLAIDIPLPAVAAVIAGLNVTAEPAWRACPAVGAVSTTTP